MYRTRMSIYALTENCKDSPLPQSSRMPAVPNICSWANLTTFNIPLSSYLSAG